MNTGKGSVTGATVADRGGVWGERRRSRAAELPSVSLALGDPSRSLLPHCPVSVSRTHFRGSAPHPQLRPPTMADPPSAGAAGAPRITKGRLGKSGLSGTAVSLGFLIFSWRRRRPRGWPAMRAASNVLQSAAVSARLALQTHPHFHVGMWSGPGAGRTGRTGMCEVGPFPAACMDLWPAFSAP